MAVNFTASTAALSASWTVGLETYTLTNTPLQLVRDDVQVNIKTPDGFFLGFPSLWNIVALYLYALPIPPQAALWILLILAFLTFVPVKHLYPSQPGRLNRFATLTGIVWGVLVGLLAWRLSHG